MLLEEEKGAFSSKVLEAVPALELISIGCLDETMLGGPALQSIGAVLRHGALQNLREVSLTSCFVKYDDFCQFIDVLEQSDCATR